MMVAHSHRLIWSALAAGTMTLSAAAQPVPRVIYSTFDASTTSHVPGTDPTAHFRWFDQPVCDPNGQWIIFSADIDADPSVNQVVIVRGTSVLEDGVLRVRKGYGIPGASLDNGPIRGPIALRPDGSFAYKTNLQPPSISDPLDPDVHNDDALVRYDGTAGTFAIVVREGDAVPGHAPEKIGTYLDSAQVLQDGNLAFAAGSTWGLSTNPDDPNYAAMDEFIIKAGQVQLRAGVSKPNGYDVDPSLPDPNRYWDHFDPDKYLIAPDSNHSLLRGDLTGDPNLNDRVLVYDGNVVLQRLRLFPAATSDPNDKVLNVKEIDLSGDGHWMAYGKYENDQNEDNGFQELEYLARDGARIARTGEGVPCPIGTAAEVLRDAYRHETFLLLTSNADEKYLYGAFSWPGGTDPNQQASVLVWGGPGDVARVVLRSGVQVDVPELAIDPVIASFKENSACLTADNVIFVVAELRLPGTPPLLGEGLLRYRVCEADADGDGDVDQDDLDPVVFNFGNEASCALEGDVDGDGIVSQDDLDLVLFELGNCGQAS